MSGQWEKYVQAAADEITYHPGNRTGTPESRHAVSVMLARAVLATVGPLIVEDTRDRMVAAAGAALEREAPPFYYCPTSGEIEQTYEGGFLICCGAPERHEPITPAAMKAAQKVPPL